MEAENQLMVRNTGNASADQMRLLQQGFKKIEPFCHKGSKCFPDFFIYREVKNPPTVSVIVPIYNVEQNLVETLDSLVHQTLSDIEIICIDDSSTDASGDILDFYAILDSRVVVLRQPNQGGGAARNRGMKHARGKYLAFVDADDFIEPDMYEKMITASQKKDTDICVCGYITHIDENTASICASHEYTVDGTGFSELCL